MEQAHGSCLALQQDWPFIALTAGEYSKEMGGVGRAQVSFFWAFQTQ